MLSTNFKTLIARSQSADVESDEATPFSIATTLTSHASTDSFFSGDKRYFFKSYIFYESVVIQITISYYYVLGLIRSLVCICQIDHVSLITPPILTVN